MARKYADDSDDDFELDEDVAQDEETTKDLEEDRSEHRELSPDEIKFYEQLPARGRGRQRNFAPVFIVLGTILLLAIVAVCVIRYMRGEPNKTLVELPTYLEIEENEVALYVSGERVESPLILEGDTLYITQDFVTENLTNKFYYDVSLGCILYTTAYSESKIELDATSFVTDGKEVSYDAPMVIRKGDTLYLSLQFVFETDAYGYGYYVDEDPMRVHIYEGNLFEECIVWTEGIVNIRTSNSLKAPLVATFDSTEDKSYWYVADAKDTKSEWTYVICTDGRYGYVQTKQISDKAGKIFGQIVREATAYPTNQKDYEILLGWHGVYGEYENQCLAQLIENASTMNVISPTWYKISSNEGDVDSFADQSYMEYAHAHGLEVWALISDFNFNYDDSMNEEKFFRSYTSRQHLISIMMEEAQKFGYDGWNIDFEYVPSDCGLDFIQFIRELSIACREAGLVLSVDNYVPRSWRAQYMREDQAECIDYYIVMGYDEHWAGCEEAGSTASIEFVKEGLDATLLEVPADKVLMGVPFYTRLWEQKPDENGELKLTSTAYTMQGSVDAVDRLGLTKTWDDTLGQYVAKGSADGVSYSIWIEDLDSMRVRIKAIRERNVAGFAAWSLGFEMPEVWNILKQ